MHVFEAHGAVQPARALAPILLSRERSEKQCVFAAARHRQLPKTPPAARAITVDLDDGRDIEMHGEAPRSAAKETEQGGPPLKAPAKIASALPERIPSETSSLSTCGPIHFRLGLAAAAPGVVFMVRKVRIARL